MEFLLQTQRPRQRKPKYQFLTEAAATVPGEFSKRHRDKEEAKNIPQAFTENAGLTSQSAMAMAGDYGSRRNSVLSGMGWFCINLFKLMFLMSHIFVIPTRE